MKANPSFGQPVEFVVSVKIHDPDGYLLREQTKRVMDVAVSEMHARITARLLSAIRMVEMIGVVESTNELVEDWYQPCPEYIHQKREPGYRAIA